MEFFFCYKNSFLKFYKGKIENNVDKSLFFKLLNINYEMFSKMTKEQNKKNTLDPQVKIIGLSEYLVENNKE